MRNAQILKHENDQVFLKMNDKQSCSSCQSGCISNTLSRSKPIEPFWLTRKKNTQIQSFVQVQLRPQTLSLCVLVYILPLLGLLLGMSLSTFIYFDFLGYVVENVELKQILGALVGAAIGLGVAALILKRFNQLDDFICID